MDAIPVFVKHQGKKYEVDLDPTSTGETFKFQLYSLTGVEPERQKILVKGGQLKDDADLSKLAVKAGHVFMMMGTASGGGIEKPKEKIKFLEDMTEAEAAQVEGAIPAGLQNLGNTCYMNSTLQALRSIPELQEELRNYHSSTSGSGLSPFSFAASAGLGGSSADLTASLRDLFKQMSETQEGFPPLMFLNTLRQAFPQFAQKARDGHGYAQQDAEEAWSQIVSQVRSKLKVKSDSDSSDSSFIDRYMAGTFDNIMECDDPAAKELGEEAIKGHDIFFKLNCHINAETNHLRDGLAAGLKEKVEKRSAVLDRDSIYTKTSRISRLPKYLPVHFMRFDWRRDTNKKAKIMRKVTFPQELDALEFCSEDLRKMLVPIRDKIREIRKEEEDVERARKRQKRLKAGEENDEGPNVSKDASKGRKKAEDKSSPTADVDMPDVEYKTDAQVEAERAAALLAAKKELLSLVDPKTSADVGSNQTGLYELRGVVTHQGASADSGHYTAFVKKTAGKDPATGKMREEDGKWWWFNDEKVTEVDSDRIDSLSGGVLTSRKYGVATVWLVATLGQKSALRKVTRKAILNVDVPKACETILTPEAPMALRLQSNLLYGVTRVYSQQCEYVLADTQSAQNSLRMLFKVVRSTDLNEDGATARPDQLLLEDDPAFLPDILLTFDENLLNMDGALAIDSQGTEFFGLRTPSLPLKGDTSPAAIVLPSSDSINVGGFDMPGAESSRAPRQSSLAARDYEVLLADPEFLLDADGNIHEHVSPVREVQDDAQPILPSSRTPSARNRQEFFSGQHAGGETVTYDQVNMNQPDNEGFEFPGPAGLTSDAFQPPSHHSSQPLHSDDAAAPQRRKTRTRKFIAMDSNTELRGRDLLAMNNDYLVNMAQQRKDLLAKKAAKLSKDGALHWILGSGINGVGNGIGASHGKTPLGDIFSGTLLYQMVTGLSLESRGQKRDSEEEADEPRATERRVRPRLEGEEDQVGRGEDVQFEEVGHPMQVDDVEMGRHAPDGLEDISSAMPWNLSVRGSSIERGPNSGKPGSITGSLGRRGTRLISASPLLGRGRISDLEPLAMAEGLDSEAYLGGGYEGLEDSMIVDEDFELYGPGAAVDTQTANQGSWQKATLDEESNNFIGFIENRLEEKQAAAREADPYAQDIDIVEFEELLPARSNSTVVAAQALLHVLTLGTKNLIRVQQSEAFGPIRLSLLDRA